MSNCDVCLISESSHSAAEIEKSLTELGHYFVRRQHMTTIDFTNPAASELIIFDSQILGPSHFACLWRIAKQFTEKPTLVVAKEIPLALYRQLNILKNTATLQKPCDPLNFGDVLKKMRAREVLKPSRFPRFNTDQGIRIMVMRTGLYLPSRMKNYSVSGAFVEYRGISLRVGDMLQVGLEEPDFNKPQKNLLLPAKVIWIRTREEVAERGPGIGVQFLQPIDAPILQTG